MSMKVGLGEGSVEEEGWGVPRYVQILFIVVGLVSLLRLAGGHRKIALETRPTIVIDV